MNKNKTLEVLFNNETMFLGWPKNIPLPTIEEYRIAESRYKKSIHKDDNSDYRCGLSFVMSTYHPFVWLHFFSYQSGKCQMQGSVDKPI